MEKKEYIERAAINTMLHQYEEWNCPPTNEAFRVVSEIKRKVHQIPAADVAPVVQCKDCKHATFYSCKNDKCYRAILCEYQIGTDDENFFCAYGERKEE